ncbi:MAG: hypothetical protein JO372_07890 [Solirubrobacterales bacterium]|nr:hypothetical protein [Solirubrobacterales bacterium]
MAFRPMRAPRHAFQARTATRRWTFRGQLAAVALVASLALSAAAAHATPACAFLTNCTTFESPSWLAVPAGSPGAPSTAGVLVSCPQPPDSSNLAFAIGSDYQLSAEASPFKLVVSRVMFGPGAGLINGGNTGFYVTNMESFGLAMKPIVGCVTQPLTTTRSAQQSNLIVNVHQRQLTPTKQGTRLGGTRQVTYTERCKAGERLLEPIGGVLFDTKRAPSKLEISQVSLTKRITKGEAQFVVRLGPDVSDDHHLALQMSDVCRD